MARRVYGTRLELDKERGLDRLKGLYNEAMKSRFGEAWPGLDAMPQEPGSVEGLPEDHRFALDCFKPDGSGEVLEMRWTLPRDQSGSGQIWTHTVQMAADPQMVRLSHDVTVTMGKTEITLLPHFESTPDVIAEVAGSCDAWLGQSECCATPWRIPSSEGVVDSPMDDIIKNQILHEEREIPVVVVTPDENGGYQFDADVLARDLAGLAIVAVIEDGRDTHALTEAVGRRLTVFGGAARIYWPDCARNPNPDWHRLYRVESAIQGRDTREQRALTRTVIRAGADSFSYFPGIAKRLEDGRRARRQARLKDLQRSEGEWMEAYEEERQRGEDATARAYELEAKVHGLESQLRGRTPREEAAVADPPAVSPAPEPRSVAEAVRHASKAWPGQLLFLKSAFESAEKVDFAHPHKAASLFKTMAEWASAYTPGEGSLVQHLAGTVTAKNHSPHISQTARGKHGEAYTFTYKGEKRLFPHHTTFAGSKTGGHWLSVHFLHDAEAGRVVIAHAGAHLPNTKT